MLKTLASANICRLERIAQSNTESL